MSDVREQVAAALAKTEGYGGVVATGGLGVLWRKQADVVVAIFADWLEERARACRSAGYNNVTVIEFDAAAATLRLGSAGGTGEAAPD